MYLTSGREVDADFVLIQTILLFSSVYFPQYFDYLMLGYRFDSLLEIVAIELI